MHVKYGISQRVSGGKCVLLVRFSPGNPRGFQKTAGLLPFARKPQFVGDQLPERRRSGSQILILFHDNFRAIAGHMNGAFPRQKRFRAGFSKREHGLRLFQLFFIAGHHAPPRANRGKK